MKSYTDLEQSRKLAKILPLESADMSYRPYREEGGIPDYHADLCPYNFASWIGVPCWSLAALLDELNRNYWKVSLKSCGAEWDITYDDGEKYIIISADYPIDACVSMIEKLHEQKLL
jgi:hypothetical protein